ncbi:MAG: DUF1858 domain-containing protein [Pelagibaca sp.]
MNPPRLNDPDLLLADMMTYWPETIAVFTRHKMLCVGCLVSPFHTLLDACAEYHLNEDDLREELRAAITSGLAPPAHEDRKR